MVRTAVAATAAASQLSAAGDDYTSLFSVRYLVPKVLENFGTAFLHCLCFVFDVLH